MRAFDVRLILNKKNNQANISLPKKKLPKSFKDKLDKIKSLKIKIEDFELWD